MDARRQMGGRKYHQQVLDDMHEHEHYGVTDEVDITTTKDYMQVGKGVGEEGRRDIGETSGRGNKEVKEHDTSFLQYMANVDESPAYLGGKENAWRRLDLTCKPSTCCQTLLDYFSLIGLFWAARDRAVLASPASSQEAVT